MRRPPYLPFLQGPPAFAVGLKPIDHWLAPDTERHVLGEKRALAAARLEDVYAQLPGSEAAQAEAAALIGQESFIAAGLSVSDDLCVMEKREGAWVLSAALLCAPSHWSLARNIGGPLTHLHGPVPDRLGPEGAQGLSARIARMFEALAPDVILERFNWTVQAGPERFAPSSAPLLARAAITAPRDWAKVLHLRVERQTVRKLPQTGAVLFTIRVCLDPLAAALEGEGARAAFSRAWKQTEPHVRAYKHWDALEPLVRAMLDE